MVTKAETRRAFPELMRTWLERAKRTERSQFSLFHTWLKTYFPAYTQFRSANGAQADLARWFEVMLAGGSIRQLTLTRQRSRVLG